MLSPKVSSFIISISSSSGAFIKSLSSSNIPAPSTCQKLSNNYSKLSFNVLLTTLTAKTEIRYWSKLQFSKRLRWRIINGIKALICLFKENMNCNKIMLFLKSISFSKWGKAKQCKITGLECTSYVDYPAVFNS